MLNGSVFTAQESFIALSLGDAQSQPSSTAMGGAQLLPSGIVKDISLEISDPQSPEHSSLGSAGQLCRPCKTVGIVAVHEQPEGCANSKSQKLRLLVRYSTS